MKCKIKLTKEISVGYLHTSNKMPTVLTLIMDHLEYVFQQLNVPCIILTRDAAESFSMRDKRYSDKHRGSPVRMNYIVLLPEHLCPDPGQGSSLRSAIVYTSSTNQLEDDAEFP